MQPEQQPTPNNNDQPPQPQVTQEQSRPEQQPTQSTQSTPPYQSTEQAPQSMPTQPTDTQYPMEDPGKVFSILGLVAVFIFMQLPGMIMSIIGYKKSKKSGHKTTLATIGIWLNAIGLLLTVAVLAFFTWAAYAATQQRAVEASRQSTAKSIAKKAEVYSIMNSTASTTIYPTIEQLRSESSEFSLTEEESARIKDTTTPEGDEIGYKTCTDSEGTITGANIYLYSDYDQQAIYHSSAGFCIETTGASMIDDGNAVPAQQ